MKVGYSEVTFSEYPACTMLSFGIKLSYSGKTRYLAKKAEVSDC